MDPDDDRSDNQRVYWHSRRGMLELDLVLMPFAESVYPGLDPESRRRFRALLACEDTDLFAWLVHKHSPQEPELARTVREVLGNGRPPSQAGTQGV